MVSATLVRLTPGVIDLINMNLVPLNSGSLAYRVRLPKLAQTVRFKMQKVLHTFRGIASIISLLRRFDPKTY